jgi:hypothetical protein
MQKKQLLTRKPAYEHGQLLLAEDFIAEQQFHIHARYRHALNLHGTGVVRGLEVTRASDSSISVSPGFAVDGRGREIELRQSEVLELQGLPAASLLSVSVGYRTERPDKDREHDRTIDCYALLRVSSGIDEGDVLLANVQLDERARLGANAISTASRQRLRTSLAPGSVTAAALDDHLRKGWLRMPFRPIGLPQDQADTKPPFRVGPTEARAHQKWQDQPNTQGAGGTMAILLPPQATRIHQLRVAGAANEKKITVQLFKGGWDPQKRSHISELILKHEIPEGAYDVMVPIPDERAAVDSEYSTLSLELRADGFARVSLVAVEISY